MRTFLDALADLVGDASEQAGYREDPAAWLRSHDAGDLTAEDVEESVPVLRRWVPSVGDRLSLDGLDPLRPTEPGDHGLDGAITVIDHLLVQVAP